MTERIKLALSEWFGKRGFYRKIVEEKVVAGTTLRAIKGTLRDTPDKDDAWMFHLSKHSRVIFDIGSNIGQAAMLMIHHPGVQKILIIDPNPKALAIAAENLFMNRLVSMKAVFVPAFVSDKTGDTVEFYTVGSGAAGSRYKEHAKTAVRLNEHFEVPTLSIDYLVTYYDTLPDLVKIDVEGAEIDVLRGAESLAAKKATTFFVEVHATPAIVPQTEAILAWCQANGYHAYYMKDRALLEVSQIKARGRYHALLVPAGQPYPSYLNNVAQGAAIQ